MRTLDEIRRDIAALKRPVCPGAVGIIDPSAFAKWREERDAWRAANPDGEERYCQLLAEIEEFESARARREHTQRLVNKLGIPPLPLSALAKLDRTPVVEGVEKWLDGEAPWLVLGGSTGAGKSVAAAHVLTRAVARGKSGAWRDAPGFATAVGGFSGQSEAEHLKHVDVMVLDDLGTEHLSPFVASVFFEVLAARHENGNRTVLTHNLSREDLRKRLGPRLADRVSSSCTYIQCTGQSLRGAA